MRYVGTVVGRLNFERFSGFYVLVALCVFFSVVEPDSFATFRNVRIILASQAITAVITLGLVVPVAAGAFDLSIAGTMTMSIVLVSWLQSYHHVNPLLAVICALLAGVIVGAVNGFVVVRLQVDSFIGTLGMSSVLGALAYWLVSGQPIVSGISASLTNAGRAQWLGMPAPVFYVVALAIVLWYVLELAPVGRVIRAVGGNPTAARLTGVNVDRYMFLSFVTSGTLAALAGVLYVSILGTADPNSGLPYLLPAFAAVFLGSTQLRPGRVNVWGTLLAIYLIAVLVKGIELRSPDNPWISDLCQGVLLIVAVAIAARGRRRER